MKLAIFLIICANIALGYAGTSGDKYSMRGTSKCVSWNNITNLCDSWEHSSTTIYTPACFPENTIVFTLAGEKNISDLVIGDNVLGFNHDTNTTEFSEFTSWIHFETTQSYDFVEIVSQNGNLTSSPFHNIAYYDNGAVVYDYAYNSGVYHSLFNGENGNDIMSSSIVKQKGIYSPLMKNYNFFIKTGNGSMVLVHCFAHTIDPLNKQFYFGHVYSFLNWINAAPDVETNHNVTQYMNPTIHTMANVFGSFMDTEPKHNTKSQRLRGSRMLSSTTSNNHPDENEQDDIATVSGIVAFQMFSVASS